MKKIVFALAALSFSVGVSATALNPGVLNTVSASATGCVLLSEGVNITLSTNVAGAYSCNAVTNTIAMTTCHPNGRKDTDLNNFFYTASSAGGSVQDAQDAVCDAAGSAADTKAVAASGEVVPDATEDDTATPDPDAP